MQHFPVIIRYISTRYMINGRVNESKESDFMKNLRRIWNEKSVSVLKKQKGDSDKTSTGKVLDDKKTVDKTAVNTSKDENDS